MSRKSGVQHFEIVQLAEHGLMDLLDVVVVQVEDSKKGHVLEVKILQGQSILGHFSTPQNTKILTC